MPENALNTCFVYVNYNANMGKKLEIKCVTWMSIEVSIEVTRKIFYSYFVIRNLFWILRGRRMLVCTWISFITLEIFSLLLSPLGKQRSTDCSCQSFLSPPQFLQQWSHWSLPQSWVMVMCTKPPTYPFTPQGLSGCSLSARHWGRSAQHPTAFSRGLTAPGKRREEEIQVKEHHSQSEGFVEESLWQKEQSVLILRVEMVLRALEWRARGQDGWEDENVVVSGGVGRGFEYEEPHCHAKEFLF